MIDLTNNHVAAISRVEGYLMSMKIPDMPPNSRNLIEDDLVRLGEVKLLVLETMYGSKKHHGNES